MNMKTIQQLLHDIFKGNNSVAITAITKTETNQSIPFKDDIILKIAVLSLVNPEVTRFVLYVGLHEDGKMMLCAASLLRKKSAEAILSKLPGFEEVQGDGVFFSEFDPRKPISAFKKFINQIGEVQEEKVIGRKYKLEKVLVR